RPAASAARGDRGRGPRHERVRGDREVTSAFRAGRAAADCAIGGTYLSLSAIRALDNDGHTELASQRLGGRRGRGPAAAGAAGGPIASQPPRRACGGGSCQGGTACCCCCCSAARAACTCCTHACQACCC